MHLKNVIVIVRVILSVIGRPNHYATWNKDSKITMWLIFWQKIILSEHIIFFFIKQ